MYCKICGAALNPGDVFCKNCGASNNIQNNPQPVAPIIEPNPPMMNQGINNQPVQPQFQQPSFEEPLPQQPMMQQPVEQQPVFTPQEPVKTNDKDAKTGKTLLIIGIVVGILALVVVVYLIIDSGILTGKKANPDGGGTVVTVKNSFNINFEGYKFTIKEDYKASISGSELTIEGNKWDAVITSNKTIPYNAITEDIIENVIGKISGAKSATIKEVINDEIKYWSAECTYNGYKCIILMVERTNGGAWIVYINEGDANSYPSTPTISEIIGLIKNATVSLFSNVENQILGNLSNLEFSQHLAETDNTQQVTQ